MEYQFKDESLKEIYVSGKEVGKPRYEKGVVRAFIKKVIHLDSIQNSAELGNWKSLHFEQLTKEKKYKGMYSIRVNDQYRLIFTIKKYKQGPVTKEILEIQELADYHV